MPNHARPGAQWPRTIARSAVLGCAGLLVSGSLMVTAASADTPGPGTHGVVSLPAPSPADRPTLTVPGRTGAKAPAASGRSAGLKAAAEPAAQRTDLNGDGYGDLAFRDNGGTVVGYWGPDANVLVSADDSQVKDLMLPGDLTGDGRADLLTLTATGELRLHSGANATTDGATAAYTTLSTGWQRYNKVLVPGDLTGDGTPDLLARSTAGLFLFPGTGTGFAATGINVGGAGWSQFVQLTGVDDVTGDGLADILARNATGTYIYPGTGTTGGFPSADRIQVAGDWSRYNQVIGGGDYNANGTADLIARGYDGTLYYFEGNGDGTFGAAQSIGTGWGVVTQFAGAGNPPNFGKSGLFARTADGTLYYYDTTGLGKLSAKILVGQGWDRSFSRLTHAVSLRANGESDLIEHSTYDGHLYNDGKYAQDDPDIAGGSKLYNLVIGPGDLSGDGKSDMLARSSTALYYYGGAGTGLSVQGRVQIGGSGWMQFNQIVGAGDLTGDGRADLVARSSEGLFLYSGTGTAATPFGAKAQVGGTGWSQYSNLAAPGDINGDGIADLLASNSAGQLYFYAGTGQAATPFAARVMIGSGGWNQYPDLV